nr:hypothetical protein [Desulfobacula sp.]
MDINSLKGASAYTDTRNTTPPVDQTQLQNQNPEASKTVQAKENANAAQKAFEVSLTEEARERMASEASRENLKTQSSAPVDQGGQGVAKAYETSRIVNIVA